MGRLRGFIDKHHRKPRSVGGTNEKRNISIVQRKRHEAYHLLFQNWTPQEIADELNATWLDPDFKLVVRPILRRLK